MVLLDHKHTCPNGDGSRIGRQPIAQPAQAGEHQAVRKAWVVYGQPCKATPPLATPSSLSLPGFRARLELNPLK
jgi:hypothetical protein